MSTATTNPTGRATHANLGVVIGRIFFCVALVALGVEHFIFGRFVTGRPPAWPESPPAR